MTCNDCRTSRSSLTVIIDSFRGIARGFITPVRGEHPCGVIPRDCRGSSSNSGPPLFAPSGYRYLICFGGQTRLLARAKSDYRQA
jgi:hypothetical protein